MREKIKLKTFCLRLHRRQLVLNAREALMGLKKKFAKFSFSKKKKTDLDDIHTLQGSSRKRSNAKIVHFFRRRVDDVI